MEQPNRDRIIARSKCQRCNRIFESGHCNQCNEYWDPHTSNGYYVSCNRCGQPYICDLCYNLNNKRDVFEKNKNEKTLPKKVTKQKNRVPNKDDDYSSLNDSDNEDHDLKCKSCFKKIEHGYCRLCKKFCNPHFSDKHYISCDNCHSLCECDSCVNLPKKKSSKKKLSDTKIAQRKCVVCKKRNPPKKYDTCRLCYESSNKNNSDKENVTKSDIYDALDDLQDALDTLRARVDKMFKSQKV